MNLSIDRAEVERALRLLHRQGDVFEVRGLDTRMVSYNGRPDPRSGTAIGYFTDPAGAAAEVASAFERAEFSGLYVLLNPAVPALHARAADRLKLAGKKDAATSDRDILRRRWVPIDFDPVRPAGISATDTERAGARATVDRVREELRGTGWPEPVLCDSGNGFHLLYAIDLPSDDGGLVKRVLEGLSSKFSTPTVKIDTTLFNAARIIKLYGTPARKGDSTPDRPHRQSRILEVPDEIGPVSEALLRAIAETTTKEPAKNNAKKASTDEWLEKWIAKHLPAAGERQDWSDGGHRWFVSPCPFNEAHTGSSAALMRAADGTAAFKCQHDGCAGKQWKDVRALLEPPQENDGAEVSGPVLAISAEELLSRPFPPRVNLISPWLAEKSLNMAYSLRGIGKTWLDLTVSLAGSSGREMFRGWRADKPIRVLHVDGEMPAEILRDRVAQLVAGGAYETEGRLRFLAADLQPAGIPSLTCAPGQHMVEDAIGDAKLIVFDNISTLFPGLDENDAGAWDPVQLWLLSLRRHGLSVLLAHHAGKGGQQRGTSKREDALDTVINLRRPEDHEAEDGCRFEVVFEKARGLTGRALQKFEVELNVRAGRATWTTREISDEVTGKILKLSESGLSLRTIAGRVGLDVANVSRRLARAKRLAESPVAGRGAA